MATRKARVDGSRPLRVLGFGTYDTAMHPRAGILLEGLRERGDTVLQVNAPLGLSTAERVAMLARPWLAYRLALRLLRRWATLVRGAIVARRSGRLDAVLVGYLGQFDVVLARLLFPRHRIVLDQLIFAADTATDRGMRSRGKLRLLRLIDQVAIGCASLVLVDTEEHRELIPAGQQDKAVVAPVGSPMSWFDAAAELGDPSPLQVVFFGTFTPLQGAPIIGEALKRLAGRSEVTVTMIGTGQDWQRTRELAAGNPNVTWHDWIEPDKLSRVIGAHHVCLGIFGTSSKALRVVPNKVFQGAAAGCVIVTSDTVPQRHALAESALYVPPGDAEALTNALLDLARDPTRVRDLRAASRRRALAQFTPIAVAAPLRAALVSPTTSRWGRSSRRASFPE